MHIRPRRNRKSSIIRDMIAETSLSLDNLIYPLFIVDKTNSKEAIDAMPGIFRYGLNDMLKEVEDSLKLGLKSFVLFPSVEEKLKDNLGSYGINPENFYLKYIQKIKEEFPEVVLMSDVALDPYNSDGHDGLVKNGEILNDESLPILATMALQQAQAGIDIIGPSDMMDGRVGEIRDLLDDHNFTDVSIMSYTAKYASAFYGPFREALESTPKSGDKKSYQMNPANKKEAIREAFLDIEEGADMIMVKPALSYLDVIHYLNENVDVPIAAYNVSGEYSMIKAAAQKNWIDNDAVFQEVLLSIRRAGASAILTYFAKEFAILKA